MEIFNKYYRLSTVFLAFAVIAGGVIGWVQGGAFSAAFNAAFAVLILCILEGSVSFDNAVLNATELETMSEKHRKWFMRWGILVAVVGMRLLFPILIVAAVGVMNPIHAFYIALTDPKQYSTILESSGAYVSAFGGAFLLMVSLSFFLDKGKEEHWLSWLESPLAKLAQLEVVIALMAVIGTSFEVDADKRFVYVVSGALGVALFVAVGALKDFLKEHKPHAENAAGALVTAGIGSLVYLEVLDASMSFDGVIGAFAVTTEIFIVMLGLGVGASYVRSMTLHLVEKKALSQFRYLEHGAQWAIGILAGLMFLKVNHHVPEVVVGLAGALTIGSAVLHSHLMNKKEAALPDESASTTA